jgi:hypothetical protein
MIEAPQKLDEAEDTFNTCVLVPHSTKYVSSYCRSWMTQRSGAPLSIGNAMIYSRRVRIRSKISPRLYVYCCTRKASKASIVKLYACAAERAFQLEPPRYCARMLLCMCPDGTMYVSSVAWCYVLRSNISTQASAPRY